MTDPKTEPGASAPDPAAQLAALRRELEATREQLRVERLKLEQTEAALWQMSALFGNVPVPVVLMEATGIVTDANHEAERMFARRREELLGRNLRSFVPEAMRLDCDDAFARCREGRVVRSVERLLWGDAGLPRVASSSLFPIRDPRGVVIGMALAEDIQEIKDSGQLLMSLNQELRQLASHDPLTGLPNRREYERVLDRELGRAARNGRLLSMAMIDIDEFKAFNDSLGHPAGDACLAAVSNALHACLHRPGDFVARYGGEEFVAVMPGTGLGGASLLAERMRTGVEALDIRHPKSEVAARVTISVGVAVVRPMPGFDARALQDAADRALYAAKRAGRNRVRYEDLVRPIGGVEPRSFRGGEVDG